jgi:hypothetical protein
MNTTIWKHQDITVMFTTESACSHDGIPVLRIKGHPAGDADCAPESYVPHVKGQVPGTAADIVLRIHQVEPLDYETLSVARRFLQQWPEGPQLPHAWNRYTSGDGRAPRAPEQAQP